MKIETSTKGMNKWEFKYNSPANGKVYHKNRNIMIIYDNLIIIYKGVPIDKEMFPCNATKQLIRRI